MKFGRTTGWTVGVSNEIRSDCHRRDAGTVTTEWCILDRSVIGDRVVSKPGDSGSFVFDFKGRLGGMIHCGGWVPDKGGVLALMSYVTHVDHLFGNIREEFDLKLE